MYYRKQVESAPGEDSQTSIIELCVKCYKEQAKQRSDMNTNIKQIKESILPILQRYGDIKPVVDVEFIDIAGKEDEDKAAAFCEKK